MGRLFEKPVRFKGPKPGRSGGGAGRSRLSRAHQMARAAMGRPSAVAKLIRTGGTRDRAGLKNQLDYVFSKSEAIVDPAGLYSDQPVLSNADMNRITRQWDATWNSRTFAGNTSHVLLSFPIGTSAEKVAAITDDVCHELLSSGDQTFEFIAGIHTDREHPHAHLIINRFANEGGPLFTFRRGGEISYEAFRESMVAHGERHGVLMQATSRFERGLLERPASTREVYAAKEEGREAQPRAHDQKYHDYATQAVNDASALYAALSVVTDTTGFQPIADACDRASEALRRGFSIHSGDIPMQPSQSDVEALDSALDVLSRNLSSFKAAIETADPALRPEYDKEYSRILSVAARFAPESEDALRFARPANDATPYNSENEYDPDGLSHPDLPALMERSLDGTGIDPEEMLARVSIGAETEYLERQWVIRDLQAIGRTHDIDLSDNINEALELLSEAYAELKADFLEVGALDDLEEHVREADSSKTVSSTAIFTSRAISALLEHHQSGRVLAPDQMRRDAADAIRVSLSTTDYMQVLRGKTEALSQFTEDETEKLYLASQVLESEVKDRGRSDLALEANRVRHQHKRAMDAGHDNDHGW